MNPTEAKALVLERYPGAYVSGEWHNHRTKAGTELFIVFASCSADILSAWCPSESAAWLSAAQRIKSGTSGGIAVSVNIADKSCVCEIPRDSVVVAGEGLGVNVSWTGKGFWVGVAKKGRTFGHNDIPIGELYDALHAVVAKAFKKSRKKK